MRAPVIAALALTTRTARTIARSTALLTTTAAAATVTTARTTTGATRAA